jgi:hypothetical protein
MPKTKAAVKIYADRNRDAIRSSIPGAIFKLEWIIPIR